MSVQSRALELAQSGEFKTVQDIEQALIREGENIEEIRRFFNIPGNKKILSGIIDEAAN